MLLRHSLKHTVPFSLWCGFLSFFLLDITKRIFESIITGTQGLSYIDKSSLTALVRPVPFVLLISYLIVMTLCALFEIGGLFHAFSMAQIGRDTDSLNMISAGLRTVRKTLRPRNWPILFFVLALYPFTRIICLSNSFKLEIPSFILQSIEASRLYSKLFDGFGFLMIAAELVFFFSVSIFIMQKKDFLHSCIDSVKLGRGHIAATILSLLLLSLCLNVLINSLTAAIFVNALYFAASMRKELSSYVRTGVYWIGMEALRHVLIAALAPAINNAGYTVMFFRYVEDGSGLNVLEASTFRTLTVRGRRRAAAIISFVVVFVVVFSNILITDAGYLMEDISVPIVCAHRGDNVHAPENTYPAFELCMAENLPWIEVDIQQAADGTIVCSHDVSIGRVCGVNIPIWQLTYEELKKYRMGDWMPGNYKDVIIPTLEEILLLARDHHVKVQIDIKESGHEKDYEEGILKVINDAGMHDNVMVISIYSDRIKRIKELDQTILTAHAVLQAWENYSQVEDADNLSIELSGVTPGLVHKIHESGMKVFCWTADNAEDIQYLVSCGVDVIGTDNPTMVLEELSRADFSGGIHRIFYLALYTLKRMEL